MAKKGVQFTQSAAQRIVRDVRWGESERKSGVGTQRRWPKPTYEGGVASPIIPVVVRTRDPELESLLISVTPVIEVDGQPQLDDENTRDMWTWWNLEARHYAALAQPVGGYGDATQVLPAMKIGDKWRVMQSVRLNFPLQGQRFRREGCLPVVVP